MRKYLFLILVFAGVINQKEIQAQWFIEKCPTRNNLNAIFFTPGGNGWIVGDKGTMLYKSESLWKTFKVPVRNNLNSLCFIHDNDGWAVGARGTILHYNGKTWDKTDCPTREDLFSVSFKDAENGIAVGRNGIMLIYENGQWKSDPRKIRGNLFTISLNNDEYWIGGGLECVNVPIMKMQNNSNKSLLRSHDSFATIANIAMINPYDGWAVGSPSTILHFNGLQWEKPQLNFRFSSLRSVFFSDIDNGISVGLGGTVLIHNQQNWIKEEPVTIQNLNGSSIEERRYYAVGDSGTILSKIFTVAGDLYSPGQSFQDNIRVYPIPCDEYLNIVFPADFEYAEVTVQITNSVGQIFVQKEFRNVDGSLPCKVNTENLSSGIYILKIKTGKNITSGRIIIKN